MISRSLSATTRFHRALPLVALALLLAARPALAQDSTLATTDRSAPAADTAASSAIPATAAAAAGPTVAGPTVAGPTVAGSAVAARVPHTARSTMGDALAPPARRHHGSAVALMAVGAAAIVIGAVAGGDVSTPLILGGAVVGLIGLYQYLL